MKHSKVRSIKISALVVTTLLAGSVFSLSSAQADVDPAAAVSPTAASTTVATAAIVTPAMATYKINYAAWLVAVRAWNAARTLEVANHVAARGVYSSLLLSNKTATNAIVALRLSLMTAANNTYQAAYLTTTNATKRAAYLKVRTTAYAAATAQATASIAALPVIGAKPVWPATAPRPVKPVKPVLTLAA